MMIKCNKNKENADPIVSK